MKISKLYGLMILSFLAVSCGSGGGGESDANSTSGDNLTGVWRLEYNNILYLLVENQSTVSVKVCNADGLFVVTKSDGYLHINGTNIFRIVSATQLEMTNFSPVGTKLNKVNGNDRFDSGSLAIQSSNIVDLSATVDVCAYRESDGEFNIIASPYYEDDYLAITLHVPGMATGNLSIPTEVSISLESAQLPGISIYAFSGEVNVVEYTDTRLRASYNFTALDGNEYVGSIDVDI